ncbi:MAG: glycosyltransferase [Candidatus Omnitrophica bacterium]|nr:glycosyltransferase [Candidatus Omnitrophota bacterium]
MGKYLKKIVVSAISFTEGGPLSIFKECLDYLSENLADSYEIIALVNDKSRFDYKNIRFCEFPLAKRAWLIRLYYEYIHFKYLSSMIKPYLWLSLHDITPNVNSEIQAVYCHNPSPFYSLSLREAYLGGIKFLAFNLFYRYLYAINIKKNDYVIVQQNNLRNKFKKLTGADRVVVAHPTVKMPFKANSSMPVENSFFYPAYPRVFKNFEVICKAAEILLNQGIKDFKIYFTIAGNENNYAKYVYNTFKYINNIEFLGSVSRERTFELYNKSGCVIFPSRLETWGMPITEAKSFEKPIILADLAYAHETLGRYDKVKFFDSDDPAALAIIMKEFIDKKVVYSSTEPGSIDQPFAENWNKLFNILLSGKQEEIKSAENTGVV